MKTLYFGVIKVSRKVLLKHDEPDTITPTILANYSSETDITNDDSDSLQMNKLSFPTAPPRRWSAEYFRLFHLIRVYPYIIHTY